MESCYEKGMSYNVPWNYMIGNMKSAHNYVMEKLPFFCSTQVHVLWHVFFLMSNDSLVLRLPFSVSHYASSGALKRNFNLGYHSWITEKSYCMKWHFCFLFAHRLHADWKILSKDQSEGEFREECFSFLLQKALF